MRNAQTNGLFKVESETPGVSQLLYSAQVKQIYSQSGPGMIGALLSSILLVVALWTTIPHCRLGLWWTLYAMLQLVRGVLVRQYNADFHFEHGARVWDRRFTSITTLSGLMWGMAGVFLFPVDSIGHQFLLALFVTGISASAAVVYSPTSCYFPTILAELLPVSARYVYQGDDLNITIGVAILVFAAVLVLSGRRIHLLNAESLRFRFENTTLLGTLAREKDRIEKLNEDLRNEIHERTRTEQALRESDTKHRVVFENAGDAIYLIDMEGERLGDIVSANQAAAALHGYSVDELLTMKISDLDTLESVGKLPERFERIRRGERIKEETTHRKKDGTVFPIDICAGLIRIANHDYVLAVDRDITDRKKVERTLVESERKYREFAEFLPQIVYESDLKGRLTFLNRTGLIFLGRSWEEIETGLELLDLIIPANRDTARRALAKLLEGENQIGNNYKIMRKDGVTFDVVTYSNPMVRDGSIVGIRGVAVDISDLRQMEDALRKANQRLESRVKERTAELRESNQLLIQEIAERERAEQALRESEAKYRAIVENIEEGYYEVDLAGNMLFFNDSMCRILGYDEAELKGMSGGLLLNGRAGRRIYASFNRVFVSGKPMAISGWDLLRKDGTDISVEASISLIKDAEDKPCGFRGIVRDITARRRLQEQLVEAQKMEAIGTLAGGIAHDFNNILYVILGYTELALDEAEAGTEMHSYLSAVYAGGQRATDLVKQVLTFSRQAKQEKKPIVVAPIVKEVLKFLKATLPATIEIRQSIQPDLKPVLADPTQIHQVLMNLCTNAGHAMKERGGILSVVLDTPAADESAYEENGNTVRDNYVRFTITDTGCGISGHVMARIFEPYFTTKSPGEGTGLGLSVVHGIVKSCGGVISVTSEIGVGTRFEVRIPTIETAPSEDDVDEESSPGGWERVLFVDDEPGVTDMGKRILESLGYTVSVRTSSLEALELFRTAPYAFDLVITDMTMPHMTGADLTREMKIIRPDIRVIVCTGYSDLLGDELIQRLGIHSVVMKPASKNTLAAVVRRALDETSERK